MTPNDFTEIKEAVKTSTLNAITEAQEDKCQCGAKWKRLWFTQSLCRVPETTFTAPAGEFVIPAHMEDVFDFHCENNKGPKEGCQLTKTVRMPLKGRLYQRMANGDLTRVKG